MIVTTAYTAYTNSSVVLGTVYYYKVQATRWVGATRVYSPFSEIVSARTVLGVPSPVTVTQISTGRIKIAWGAVSGGTRYEVWRSITIDGLYTRMATTGYTYYVDANLTAGGVYFYKIRAYRFVSGSVVYGDYSAIVEFHVTS